MPLTGEDILLYEKRDHIVIITINRPERMNAVSLDLMDRLGDAWEQYRDDDQAWCAILTAAGDRAFSAGRDLREVVADGGIATAYNKKRRHSLDSSVPTGCEGLWKPVIAAINGYAIAGGWHLAQNCDIRIAAEHATFGIAEVKWNLRAAWTANLTRYLTMGDALYIVLSGERITAQRAYEIGFLQKVVPYEQLMDEALKLAETIASNGPMSVRFHKELLYRATNLTYKEGEALGNHILAPLKFSEDSKEGPKAFVEKRKPQWKNR